MEYNVPIRDLPKEEKKEYFRLAQQRYRKHHPEHKEKTREYSKKYYEKNKERINTYNKEYKTQNREKIKNKAFNKRIEERGCGPYEKSLAFEMFGCRVREMNKEQKRLYNNERCRRYYRKKKEEKKNNLVKE